MKTTGVFRTHLVEVPVSKNGQTLHLVPFGDVHRDSPHHAHKHWQADLAEWRALPNALFIGLGDYTDFLSTSERIRIRDGDGVHDSTHSSLDKLARKQIHALAKELDFMRGRLLGLVNGNHYYQFRDGTTGDHLLANLLGTEFLGVAAFVRIVFKFTGASKKCAALDLFCHHGAGTGQKPPASLAAVARMAEWTDADIVLQGHDHKRGVLPMNPILGLSDNRRGPLRVKERQRWIGRTGSYLKAYIDGEASYNVDAGRGPCSIGHIRFEITPYRCREARAEDGDRVDLRIRAIQ